jgi:3-dehydroquinate dehydratase type II
MRILVLNGPNINLVGKREPELYGSRTYDDLKAELRARAVELGVEIEIKQTNHEGTMVDIIQAVDGCYEGVIINGGAYTHTSIAILDAIKAVDVPFVEVHFTDPDTREDFRKVNYLRMGCVATFKGMGFESYFCALEYLVENK